MSSSPIVHAINSADNERLRKTLMAIIADPRGKELVESELLVPSNNTEERPKKRNRYEICAQCGEEFEYAKTKEYECVWHSGKCEVDWDSGEWDDTNEDVSGPIDTEENREEYPDGFYWTCCKGAADAQGCEKGFHKECVIAKRACA
ncbi:hypothetical protein BFW01_g11921 [Lasiodiplodia theobromae]|uniref:uncharacterized protein n=1 Tax=Lasiodiplodia theobromae TaxID=45133 RepID=UPI0015C2E77D|nr:uncharacterized protein LTHEOB_3127 [Lasiodiplodia theobromae]KAF4534319.1 hypothetical protein LTHEOB_3127 [Lasiodiplodia theobromae]KAF9640115.1 hypothetical protein BFW01_g11921 [Lasiodiplodia theobromae]